MKLLWHSNAPFAPTGYGQQTALFTPRLKDAGYDVGVSAFYGLHGAPLVWKGIPILPGQGQDFGNGFLLQHVKNFFDGDLRSGLVFTLMDVFVLNPQMAARTNMAAWTPVDHEPVMPGVTAFFKDSGAIPVAMSRFGEEQLRQQDLDPLYVPHGVDTKVYYPREKRQLKMGDMPRDAFIVGMVAANKGRPSRKCFQEAMQAFAIFRQKHDDAMLYLHTITDPNDAAGEDIMALAQMLGLNEDNFFVAPSYQMRFEPFPADSMAQLYSCFDVLLNPSAGEGFGVPIIEAAACGVPSIVTDFTAMPEVAGDAGWKVGFRPWWTPGNSFMAHPNVEDIVAALEICYGESNRERQERKEAARRHALKYDPDKVMAEHFLPALAEIEDRVGLNVDESAVEVLA